MKILGIILALLMVGLGALVAVTGTNKAFQLGDDIAKVQAEVGADQLETLAAAAETDVPSAGRLKAGGGIMALGGLAGVLLFVVMFVRKRATLAFAAAAVALSALAIVVLPYVEVGELSGFAPRTHAIITTVMMAIAGAGALLATRRKASDAAAA